MGVLLLALAIRIGKSVVTLMAPQYMDVLTAIGVVAMFVIGPSLYAFFTSSFGSQEKSISPWFHFIPSAVVAVVMLNLYRDEDIVYYTYLLSLVHLLAYIILSAEVLARHSRAVSNHVAKKSWGRALLATNFVIWTSFMVQVTFETYFSYLLATIMATVSLFSMAVYSMINQNHTFLLRSRNMDHPKLKSVAEQVMEFFHNSNSHLSHSVTVSSLAEDLNVQQYMVSQAINNVLGKTLPELVNEQRIAHAKKLLAEKDHQRNIKTIAFESGFTTLSAFYASFNKVTAMTPKEFEKTLR